MHSGMNERKQRHEQSVKRKYIRLIGYSAIAVTLLTLFGAYSLACSYVYVAPSLPSVEAMRKVEMQVPLRVFTSSGELIAQIGEQRRLPVAYEQIPPLVRQAFLAAEDDQFFQHGGVDYLGILRALVVNLVSNEKAQGASTITQQAARNMFLTLFPSRPRETCSSHSTRRGGASSPSSSSRGEWNASSRSRKFSGSI